MRTCLNCGHQWSRGPLTCPKCGSDDVTISKTASTIKYCGNCNSRNSGTAKKCSQCGNKL